MSAVLKGYWSAARQEKGKPHLARATHSRKAARGRKQASTLVGKNCLEVSGCWIKLPRRSIRNGNLVTSTVRVADVYRDFMATDQAVGLAV